MLPDADVETNEVIRPFVIVQPQYRIHKQKQKAFKEKKRQRAFNKATDPPNSTDFFKEMN